MPQRKPAKRTKMKKPAAKRQTQNSLLALAEKVEKEFRQLPTKLAKLYQQEVMAHKQQEKKLKDEIKKVEVIQKKQASVMKAKTKPTQKQLMAAKKSNQQTTKTINQLTTQLNQTTKNGAMLLAKQNKYTALNKELAKLDKQLTLKATTAVKASSKPAKKAKSTQHKQAKSTQQQAPMEKTMTEETPFMISSKDDVVEM